MTYARPTKIHDPTRKRSTARAARRKPRPPACCEGHGEQEKRGESRENDENVTTRKSGHDVIDREHVMRGIEKSSDDRSSWALEALPRREARLQRSVPFLDESVEKNISFAGIQWNVRSHGYQEAKFSELAQPFLFAESLSHRGRPTDRCPLL